MRCPKCDADITDTYQEEEADTNVGEGWFCDACDLAIAGWEHPREPLEGDVAIPPDQRKLGTPISELSGRPGHPGYEEFKRIARSWGYD